MRGGLMAGKIKALPSVIVMPDSSEKELDSLSDEQREIWDSEVCQRIGNAIREQYASCIQEWNIFAEKMTS